MVMFAELMFALLSCIALFYFILLVATGGEAVTILEAAGICGVSGLFSLYLAGEAE